MKEIDSFFLRHNFNPHIELEKAVPLLIEDMQNGLKADFKTSSSMDMIPLWKSVPNEIPKNKSVIIIDAGGTNFRTALVRFDKAGQADISSFFKYKMPALDKEMNNEEFFDAIADYLEPLKDKAETVSFCFSFAIKIFPDGGGEAIKLSKEIKLPKITECKINEGLHQALLRKGWTSVKKVIMVNDTAAVLLSGIIPQEGGKICYDSFIGFVLGTGLNSCYIEYDNIEKIKDTPFYGKPQMVVCESGKSCKIKQSEFDKELSETSNLKDEYFLERMCSGRYVGQVCSIALRTAARFGIFSEKANKDMINLPDFTTEEISVFLKEQNNEKNIFSSFILKNGISLDYIKIYYICNAFFERAARLSAAVFAAAAIKTGKGKSPEKPLCIMGNGSVFSHGFLMKERIFKFLYEFLTEKTGVHFVLKTSDNSVSLGTAIAGI
ncbi:hexokinase [Treponema pedis]|uniref:Hexokinase n=1 Tax=Treponema pedis TaxID=409322 RepID=A0A7S6WRD7_9SPIR|nr:hexokinase [Treponema pedis]QOW61614.1 hexokinase [Treponema pedis]